MEQSRWSVHDSGSTQTCPTQAPANATSTAPKILWPFTFHFSPSTFNPLSTPSSRIGLPRSPQEPLILHVEMESLSDIHWDVVISGTGLQQSLLALLVPPLTDRHHVALLTDLAPFRTKEPSPAPARKSFT
jgi:hypothetical protein